MTQKTNFETEGYSISIKGKNVQVTDAINTYVMEKIEKVERFANHIIEVIVTIDIQKMTHSVSIIMKFLHFKIQVHASTENTYSAIDKASDKLLKLIRKYKTKLQDHHAKKLSSVDMTVNVLQYESDVDKINDLIEEENLKKEEEKYKIHKVVAKETMPIKMFTQDEAIMKMELSGDQFLIYKAEEEQKMRVIYRRKEDGEYGIVEIQS
jgi:putative sigma-54 modulation protein